MIKGHIQRKWFLSLKCQEVQNNRVQISGVQLLLKGLVVKCLLHADGILRNEWQPLRLFFLIFSSKFLAPQDFHISSCSITHCKDNCNRKTREIRSLFKKQENHANCTCICQTKLSLTKVVNQSKEPINSVMFQSLNIS